MMIYRKRFSKVVSAILGGCILGTSILPGIGVMEVHAQETSDMEWEQVSSILDSYPGIYTEDTKLGSPWNTGYSPDGPLMGNGTVYAFMAGDRKEQNLYISQSNMWQDRKGNNGQEYTTFGGITIREYEGDNIAAGKPVTVSSKVSDKEGENMLVDKNVKTKWCSTMKNNNNSSTYWAVIDLKEKQTISSWTVKHAQAGGEGADYNTRDFKLQYSTSENPDGNKDSDWQDADVVEENTDAVTVRNLVESIQTQYVRLLVTKPSQDNSGTVRICELELYENPKTNTGGEKVQDFRYEQDMKNAEITAQSESGFTTKTWLSAKENVLVTEISNVDEDILPLEVSAWTVNQNKSAEIQGDTMIASKQGISKAKPDRPSGDGTWEGWTVNVAMASKIIDDVEKTVIPVSEGKNATRFSLNPGQTVTLVSAVEGGKEDAGNNTMEQAIEKAVTELGTKTSADALGEANQKHREYWRDYWMKSYIDIQDEKIERMYYGMLYQLGCSTSAASENNGGIAAGLFPWTASDHPAWQGDYTTNTDFQRQIHPLVTANRTEGIQNYINIIKQYWSEAQRRSGSVEHLNWVIDGTPRKDKFTEGISDGALMPTHIGPWGASTEQYDSKLDYWNSPADATSVLMPVIKLWKCTQDDELLNEIYPMMKDVATFWEKYITYENGKYVVYGATHEGQAGRNPILDVDACKYMLKNTILAAEQLGVDSDRISNWKNIVENMSEVPTMQYKGKTTICDVEGRKEGSSGPTFDGNPVTIQSVYYFDSIGMNASDEEKEKYINYLNVKNGLGNHRRLISATRLGYDIHEIMDQLKAGSIDPKPSDWEGLRGNNTIGDIGTTGRLAIVQDSLLQSNEGYLNIFANWYEDQGASFRRLRAENAFLVDADMNDGGEVTYASIYSEKGRDCAVLNPWKDQGMKVYEDGNEIATEQTENSLGTVYHFQTKAGSSYELKPDGNIEPHLQLDVSELKMQSGDIQQLTAKTNIENPVFKWQSSDQETAIAGVDGRVFGLKQGTTEIKVTLEGTDLSASCFVSVEDSTELNVAPKGIATASSTHETLTAQRAISGDWKASYEGWVSKNESWNDVNSRWLQIDLGQEHTISRWVLRHGGHRSQNTEDPVGNPKDDANWGNYYLQISPDGENDWTTIDSKIDNKNNTTNQILDEPVTGRYFRIYMEFPMFKSEAGWKWQSGFARLNQVELYEQREIKNYNVTEIGAIDSIEVKKGSTFESLKLPETVQVHLDNDFQFMTNVDWAENEYNADKPGTQQLTGTLALPSGIANPSDLKAQVQITVTEDTSKATLEKLLNRAKQHVEDGDVDGLAESIKQLFAEAIEEGEAVMAKEDASKEEMLNACMKLLKAIQSLEFKAGDKADLGMALELAGIIDLTAYVEAGQTEYLKAKTDAEAVMANGDAMQEEVDTAWSTLVDAMMNLRLKADKAALEALLESIKTIDLTLYTEESVTVFSQARENAEAVMANANLSVEEQSIVDDSVKNLQTAKDNLVLKTASGGEDNNGGDSGTGNGNNGGTGNNGGAGNNTGTNDKGQNASQGATIKTGDVNSITLPIVSLLVSLGLMAAAGVFMVKKRSRK